MDVARPRGVVAEASLFDVIEDDLTSSFVNAEVYLKGVAEDAPIAVFHTDQTIIPPINRRPLVTTQWVVECEEKMTFKELKQRAVFLHVITREPADLDGIEFRVAHPKVTSSGRAHKTMLTLPKYKAAYVDDAGRPRARVDYAKIASDLEKKGVKSTWTLTTEIRYRAAPT
jgi:hypothetical protein